MEMEILLVVFLVILVVVYVVYKMNEVRSVEAKLNKKKYIVLNRIDAKDAANILAEISIRLGKMQTYLEKNHNNQESLKKIKEKFNPQNISEGSPDSQYTSYTINKGEKMVFCIRDKETKKLHDINLMMYVALHELAHVMTVAVGHGSEFHTNFDSILKIAEEQGLYQKLPLGRNQIKYCGMSL